MPTTFTLVRHGETSWNAQGRWQGHAPIPLNEEGERQAQRLAEYFTLNPVAVQAIYSSDLARARATAEAIAQCLSQPTLLDTRLREIDLGDWQGMTKAEILKWDRERFDYVQLDPANTPRPGGESPAQVGRRGVDCLLDYASRHPNDHVIVVSHGGIIRRILIDLQLHPEGMVDIENTSLTQLIYDGQNGNAAWSLVYFNQTPHLAKIHAHDTHED